MSLPGWPTARQMTATRNLRELNSMPRICLACQVLWTSPWFLGIESCFPKSGPLSKGPREPPSKRAPICSQHLMFVLPIWFCFPMFFLGGARGPFPMARYHMLLLAELPCRFYPIFFGPGPGLADVYPMIFRLPKSWWLNHHVEHSLHPYDMYVCMHIYICIYIRFHLCASCSKILTEILQK